MATTDDLTASPIAILQAMRGRIERATYGYPEVLLLDIRDDRDGLWLFSTQDADYVPIEPAAYEGRVLENIVVSESGALRLDLSDGVQAVITPGPPEEPDDPPYWELITPDGLHLEYGPGLRWQFSSADAS